VSVQISVIGSGSEYEVQAEEIGGLLAERGATVVTGGLGEVMAAASCGAKNAGGTTIGIEIGFALTLGRPVVILDPGWDVDGALRADSPQEAVELAMAALA
jgi:hypothetical protein